MLMGRAPGSPRPELAAGRRVRGRPGLALRRTTCKSSWLVANNVSTNRAGESALLAQLERRGASAIEVVPGRRREVRFIGGGRSYALRIKARRAGTWQPGTNDGQPRSEESTPSRFWVFVDLAVRPPDFYVVPEWWAQNDIYHEHQAYLARHGGHRAGNPASTHHALGVERIAPWLDRWDLLGFPG